MPNPLVSVITPCFNGETHVHRLLDSLLEQTYDNIEFIFVNNGSTDRTHEILMSYKPKIEQAGISFIYIEQKNSGAAGAVNTALKKITGKYLTWPDADDILHNEYLKHKVNFLENHKELAIVISKSRILDEDSLEIIGSLERKIPKNIDDLFSDLVFNENVYYAPGGYMLRSSAFLEVNPTREIYVTLHGQNLQMLLPVAYRFKHGYLDEYLYDYLFRKDSYSRNIKTKEQNIAKTYIDEDVLVNVLKSIDMKEEHKFYLNEISIRFSKKRLNFANLYNDHILAEKEFCKLRELKRNDINDFINFICTINKIFHIVYKCHNFLNKKVKRIFWRIKKNNINN